MWITPRASQKTVSMTNHGWQIHFGLLRRWFSLQNWSLNSSPNHKKQVLNGRVARKKPFINMRNLILRIEFAVNHLKNDESWWNGDFSRWEQVQFVWKRWKAQTQYRAKTSKLKTTVKHGAEQVMVWGLSWWKITFFLAKCGRFFFKSLLNRSNKLE